MSRIYIASALKNKIFVSHSDAFALLFLSATIVVITSFDYIWYGGIPLWLMMVILGCFVSMLSNKYRRAFRYFATHTFIWFILPWILFVIGVATIDVIKGQIELTLSKRILLNLAVLWLALMIGTWVLRVRPSNVIYILAGIGALQGLLCIAQFYGNDWAWRFPEFVIRKFGAHFDKSLLVDEDFFAIQRVRGTHIYVHKFNSMQGMILAFLLTVLILNIRYNNTLKLRTWILVGGTLFTGIGMFLTFSRSTIFGNAIVFSILIAINVRRFSVAVIIIIFIGFAYFAYEYLELYNAGQFSRITDFNESRITNKSRIDQYVSAIHAFSKYPVIGGQSAGMTGGNIVHSVPLRLMVDYGAVGILLYVIVIGGILRFLLKCRNKCGGGIYVLSLAGLSSVFVALLDAFTHSSGLLVRDVSQGGMIAAFMGLVMHFIRNTPSCTRRQVWIAKSSR